MRHLNSSTQWGITTQAMQLTPKEKPASGKEVLVMRTGPPKDKEARKPTAFRGKAWNHRGDPTEDERFDRQPPHRLLRGTAGARLGPLRPQWLPVHR